MTYDGDEGDDDAVMAALLCLRAGRGPMCAIPGGWGDGEEEDD
jgi:hypothetical protein